LASLGIVRNKLHGEIYDGNCDPKAKQNKNSDSFRPTRVRRWLPRYPDLDPDRGGGGGGAGEKNKKEENRQRD